MKALDIYQIQVATNGQTTIRPPAMQGVRIKDEKEVLEHFAGVVIHLFYLLLNKSTLISN